MSSHHVIHYLGNFCFAGKVASEDCAVLLQHFMDLTQEFGVPLAHKKTEGPGTTFTFLIIELDTR